MVTRLAVAVFASCSLVAILIAADPPAATEAWPPKIVRKLPPPPMKEQLPPAEIDRIAQMAANLRKRTGTSSLPSSPASNDDFNDVEIFPKALEYALRHGEFFDVKKSPGQAEAVTKAAEARMNKIAGKDESWKTAPGPLVRGYRSRLDDSVQPYGLVIPAGLDLSNPVPLYVWLHGRGDTMCDLQFIYSFLGTKAPGPLQPTNAIVLHPFGRYCNGFKSAGEVDVLEAIADVQKKYKIDPDRIVLAGFSMGGAGAWHMGAHYADRWCAVHAGAGFVDVRRYQNLTAETMPPPIEQKLWGLYDVPDYRRNLLNVPLLAYSGEEDKQKAAADIMEAELKAEGLKLTHLIGPKMGHKYDPEVLKDVHARLAKFVEQGRTPLPQKVSLQTKTLRYNKMFWVEALGLKQHWEDSRIDAESDGKSKITVTTKGITAFRLTSPFGWGDDAVFGEDVAVQVDGETQAVPGPLPAAAKMLAQRYPGLVSEPSHAEGATPAVNGVLYFVKNSRGWICSRTVPYPLQPDRVRRKLPGLQGPIDDAFMKSFSVVPPAAAAPSNELDRWAQFEHGHFVERWRMLMRGEPRSPDPRLNDPSAVAAAAAAAQENLILWGRPSTNSMIARLLRRLPLVWNAEEVGIGDLRFDATKVMPMLIYPNPDAPTKYVVINGGLTFRESHDRTNSLQNPKLGDWAFIDVTEPPTDEAPGKVLATGFFDEQWQYVPAKK